MAFMFVYNERRGTLFPRQSFLDSLVTTVSLELASNTKKPSSRS